MKNLFLTTLTVVLFFINGFSQTISDNSSVKNTETLKGTLLDLDKKTPLPYANILVLHKNVGTITNEKGQFSLNIAKLNENDTLRFTYIGFKAKDLTIKALDSTQTIYLKEDAYNLNEIFVFGGDHDPKEIIKKVLENKSANYNTTLSKKQVFIRNRSISDINKMDFKFKKSSFSELSEDMVASIKEKVPKHSISYTDFLGNLYFSRQKEDSVHLKVDAIKVVSLKDKDLADLNQIEDIFNNLFKNTKEKEYWKLKSGLIGGKIDFDDDDFDEKKIDSIDALNKHRETTSNRQNYINYQLKYSSLNDKKEWEFLHNPSKYEFTLVGGTTVNEEDVYIIDFVPKKSGKFEGRVYISTKTYALLRADYAYAAGKVGTDFHLLGVGYTVNKFNGSIYFEKVNDTYQLKYCSKKIGVRTSINRNLSLIKKKKQFLFDKKLNEIKIKFNLSVTAEDSFEVLVLKQEKITNSQFLNFQQKEFSKKLYVNQFNDAMWKGYSIIEPTQQMREYKKQDE